MTSLLEQVRSGRLPINTSHTRLNSEAAAFWYEKWRRFNDVAHSERVSLPEAA